jgi:hypothetical protein
MQFYAACLNDDVVALSYLARAMSMATSWAQPADSHVEHDGHSDGEFRLKIVTLLELMHQVAHRRIRMSQAMRLQNGNIPPSAAAFAIPESSGIFSQHVEVEYSNAYLALHYRADCTICVNNGRSCAK